MKRATLKYQPRFPGICADAAALGVHRVSLYKVLAGERPGKSLTARYHALKVAQKNGVVAAMPRKHANSPKPPPPPLNYAAAENLSPALHAMLAAFGKDIVLVHFTCKDNPTLMERLLCEQELNAALVAAKAGYYDSTAYNAGSVLHFFHVRNLGAAVRILKEQIGLRGLLDNAYVIHVESPDKQTVWWPNTAAAIDASQEDDDAA